MMRLPSLRTVTSELVTRNSLGRRTAWLRPFQKTRASRGLMRDVWRRDRLGVFIGSLLVYYKSIDHSGSRGRHRR